MRLTLAGRKVFSHMAIATPECLDGTKILASTESGAVNSEFIRLGSVNS